MLLNKRTTSENTRYPTKRLRTRLTFAQKKDVCVKLSSKPKPSQGELAEEYGVKLLISGKIRRSGWQSTQSQKSSIG